jgi:hypothetical protein
MRTLLIESLPGCGRDVEDRLLRAGHEVVRCRPQNQPIFPCSALTTGCPLEDPRGVDAAVTVRTLTEPDQTVSEMGVTCALRVRVPVIAVGPKHGEPFHDLVRHSDEHDLLAAYAEAVDAARDEIVGPLRAEARHLVARHGGDDALVDVAIEHDVDRTRIVVTLPPGAEGVEQSVATHVHARYRPTARRDRAVDVEIARSAVTSG